MKIKAIILIMIVFTLLITSVPVFADIPIPAIPMDAWEYWVVIERIEGGITKFELKASHNPITAPTTGTQLYFNTCRTYILDDGEWIFNRETLSSVSTPIVKVYASSHDIAYHNAPGFFFTVPKASTLFLSMKRVDSGMLLRTILAGSIPLVGLILSVTCLRKGWDFLRSQLMR